jgi:hypothetical protein
MEVRAWHWTAGRLTRVRPAKKLDLWPTAAEVLAVVAAKPASFERLEVAIMELAIAPGLCGNLRWAVEASCG